MSSDIYKVRIFFWIFLVSLVIFRYFSSRPNYLDGQKLRITSTVVSEPTKFSSFQNLKIAGLAITLPAYPEINYGDKVIVEGEVFSGTLQKAVLADLKGGGAFWLGLRKSLVNFYTASLPEPHASLVSGIVLGAKGSFAPDFWNSLRNSGVTHVVVASGMNVAIAAGFFLSLAFLFLPRPKAIPAALAGVWFYVLISGIQAPVVRAGIMSSLVFLFQAKGRLINSFSVLFLSALVMLIIVPSWISDIGFILSFVATAALMLFENKIKKALAFVPNFLQFRDGLSTSLSAQIGVAPIIFSSFGQFNPVSPIINALVLWTIPYIMLIGTVSGVIGLVVPILGRLTLYLVYPLTWWFIWVVETFT